MEEAYNRERMRATVAIEEVHAERARARMELSKEKGQVTVLMKAIKTVKTEREVLIRQVSKGCVVPTPYLESPVCYYAQRADDC